MLAAGTGWTAHVDCGHGTLMRILAVADTTETWTEETVRAAHAADLIVSLGDLYRVDLERFTGGAPIIGVYGNHCREGYLQEIGAVEITPKNAPVAAITLNNGLTVLGVSGCVRYSNAAYHQWTQEEYRAALENAPRCDWVVTHCPPRGVNDHEDRAHLGIDALRGYVDTHKPSQLFHGHTYPEDPMTHLGDTIIHYVHGWALLDVPAPRKSPASA